MTPGFLFWTDEKTGEPAKMTGMSSDGLLGRFDAFWEDRARIEYGFKMPEQWFLDEAEKMHPDGLRVLDLGCGNGRNAVPLARKGCKVTGVDISKVALSLLAKKAKIEGVSVDAIQSDFASLSFPSESFGLCVCYNSIFNCRTGELFEVFGKVKTWLSPKGRFLVTLRSSRTPAPDDSVLLPGESGTYITKRDGFEHFVHYSDREEVEKLSLGWNLVLVDETEELLGIGENKRKVWTFRLTLEKP